jgi:hypothetical protein
MSKKPVDVTKLSSVQLPNRAAMNNLAKSGRSILDYAKATPLTPAPAANLMQNLRPKATGE